LAAITSAPISDAIIARISQAGGLTVRPTSAVRRYATTETDALAAAKEQLVDAVLEGSWQRDGDRLRVSVNLLRQADGASLWADRLDVEATDIFAVQDQVSERLVAQLRLKLSPDGQARVRQGGTTNAEAYDAFTKGQFYFGERGFSAANRQNSDRAIELFERAVALDPEFFKFVSDFDKRFPEGAPSLKAATSFTVEGDWTFGNGVSVAGTVSLDRPKTAQRVAPGTALGADG